MAGADGRIKVDEVMLVSEIISLPVALRRMRENAGDAPSTPAGETVDYDCAGQMTAAAYLADDLAKQIVNFYTSTSARREDVPKDGVTTIRVQLGGNGTDWVLARYDASGLEFIASQIEEGCEYTPVAVLAAKILRATL